MVSIFMKNGIFAVRAAALPAALLVLGSSLGVSAQTLGRPASLPEVVVTATRTPTSLEDTLAAVTVISAADIAASQASDLPSLLENVPGIELSRYGGRGTISNVLMRGAESRHTLLLLDGMAMSNLNFGTTPLEHITLADIDRIEIVRGNVSSVYGSAALGGVIQIFTKKGNSASSFSASLDVGSNDYRKAQIGGALRIGESTRLSYSVDDIQDGSFNATNQTERTATNPDRDAYQRRAVSLGLSHELGGGVIGLNLRDASGKTAYDNEFGPASQPDEATFHLQSTSLFGRFSLGQSVQLHAAFNDQSDDLKADVTAYPYFVVSRKKSFQFDVQNQFSAGQTVSAGLETAQQTIKSDTDYTRASREQNSVYVGYLGNFSQHQVQLQARQDIYSDFGSANTWLAGYAYRLSQAWRVNGSISTGFTAPTFNDLYYPWGGNAKLRPEKAQSQELGLQYRLGTTEVRVVLFNNEYTDLIANDENYDRVNLQRAHNRGLEWSWLDQFGDSRINSSLTLQDPVDDATGKRLLRRAAISAKLGLTHQAGQWTWGAAMRGEGERLDQFSGTDKALPAYLVMDATASYRIQPEISVKARIDNLSDQRYETVYGYRQMPRTIYFGLTWTPSN